MREKKKWMWLDADILLYSWHKWFHTISVTFHRSLLPSLCVIFDSGLSRQQKDWDVFEHCFRFDRLACTLSLKSKPRREGAFKKPITPTINTWRDQEEKRMRRKIHPLEKGCLWVIATYLFEERRHVNQRGHCSRR